MPQWWLWPNLKLLAKTFQDNDIRSGSRSPMIMIPLLAAIMVALLGVLPLPLSTSVEGVVQLLVGIVERTLGSAKSG